MDLASLWEENYNSYYLNIEIIYNNLTLHLLWHRPNDLQLYVSQMFAELNRGQILSHQNYLLPEERGCRSL